MHFINRAKEGLHRDLVANPQAQGWVLNLYLAGERYPQTVCDYFQSEFAPSPQLADDLCRHQADEYKHELVLLKALHWLRQPELDLPRQDVFNEIVRSFTPGTFHIVESDPSDVQRWKMANFLAHAHFLEKRVAGSLYYHLDASEKGGRERVAKALAVVLADERRHIQYTHQAVFDLLTRRQAREVLEAHCRVEAKANLKFSYLQIRQFLACFSDHIPIHRRLLHRVCAMLMEGALRHV